VGRNKSQDGTLQTSATLTAALVVVVTLYFARDIFIPLALALVLSFLLTPGVRAVERLRVGRVPAVLLVVGLSVTIIAGASWVVAVQITALAQEIPKYRHNIIEKARALRASATPFSEVSETVEQISQEIRAPASRPASQPAGPLAIRSQADDPPADPEAAIPLSFGSPALAVPPLVARNGDQADPRIPGNEIVASRERSDEPVRVQVVPPGPDLADLLSGVAGSLAHSAALAGVAAVFCIFFLAYREDLRDRLIRLSGRARIQVTTSALSDVAQSLTRYLVAQVVVNAINGVAVAVGLFMIGVPNAALWGLLSAVLRFVPFVGTWIAAVLPITLSIAVFEGWARPLLVAGWILVVDMISLNVLEPLLYGARTGTSATALVIFAVFCTWLWGGIGLFLATPITVCLVVLGKYIPQLEVLYVLLSDRPALEPHLRLYQRLVARDRDEAIRIVQRAARSMGPEAIENKLLRPVLAEIGADHRAGVLDRARQAFARETVAELRSLITPELTTDPDQRTIPPTPGERREMTGSTHGHH